jgi:hypothetical protein
MPQQKSKSQPTPVDLSELKPFKIVGQLIGARYDEQGEIVGEEVMGQVGVYASQFGQVQELVDGAVEEMRAAEKAADAG